MSCGFSKHNIFPKNKKTLYEVQLHTEYTGSTKIYVLSDQSPRDLNEIELHTYVNGIEISILNYYENNLDMNQTYSLPYLRTLKKKKVNLSQSSYDCDILVNCYEYILFLKEQFMRFPYNELYIISGINEFENAYWNGYYLVFGNGLSRASRPLTSPAIIGHELTHAVIQATNKLEYKYESGALNESFADIFGTMLEFYLIEKRSNSSIGFNFASEIYFDHHAMRSFKDPNSTGCPASIHDPLFCRSSYDNGGVHINSSVINHLFYRMQLLEENCLDGNSGRKNTFNIFINVFNKLKHNSNFSDFKRIILLFVTDNEKLINIINEIL